MQFEYQLTRSKRKTFSISISRDLKVLIKAPLKASVKDIEAMIAAHSDWIEKHIVLRKELEEKEQSNVLTPVEIERLKQNAKAILPQKVEHFSKIMGVTPACVKITSATTRWGSCSGRNSLCFSYRLMLLPEGAIDYIVVHELAHIRVKNHSKKFYKEIETYMPDYKDRIMAIKQFNKQR